MIIDNLKFAKNNESHNGSIDTTLSKRINDGTIPISGIIKYHITGHKSPKPTMSGEICGRITTLCQICLKDIDFDINQKFDVQIFNSEEELEVALFDKNEGVNDGVVKNPEFDVVEFIEDEILMSLPLSIKHSKCKLDAPSKTNPFEVLKNM